MKDCRKTERQKERLKDCRLKDRKTVDEKDVMQS